MNRIKLLGLGAFVAALTASSTAFAQDGAAEDGSGRGLVALAAALAIGLAALGGTTAQGRAASHALEGIARNPGAADKMFTPLLLSLALMESLVIFSLLIAFTLAGNV
ncbi:MAG: hypothetical protein EA398_13370 [Deltaproteobacteria bacterium]|nr:MAG: hypothetical protein EA398_13370 [Deltaproteobacteria bacterium]